jgi:hypothetical protein
LSRPLFKPPSLKLGWALYAVAGAVLGANFMFLVKNIQEGELGNIERVWFAIVFSLMVVSCYLLFGYHYLRWAAYRKSELYLKAMQDPNIFFEKYNRIFIDDVVCTRLGVDPLRFKRLRQADLRDITEKLTYWS